MRYKIPSITPQAMLQPSAPISMMRTSARPASATLSEPVNVRTMIRPKSTSEMRSYGSSTLLVDGAAGEPAGFSTLAAAGEEEAVEFMAGFRMRAEAGGRASGQK